MANMLFMGLLQPVSTESDALIGMMIPPLSIGRRAANRPMSLSIPALTSAQAIMLLPQFTPE
jgi:hypothetical protein